MELTSSSSSSSAAETTEAVPSKVLNKRRFSDPGWSAVGITLDHEASIKSVFASPRKRAPIKHVSSTKSFASHLRFRFPRKTFMPNDPRLARWDKLMFITLTFSVYFIPLDCAVFTRKRIDNQINSGVNWAFFGVATIIQLVYMIDTCINFARAVYDKKGMLVYEPHRVRWLYLRSWFIVDFLSCFPGAHIIRFMKNESEVTNAIMLLGLLRLLRLTRFRQELRSFSPRGSPLRVFAAYFLGLATVCHWGACTWIFIADLQDSQDGGATWVTYFEERNAGADTTHPETNPIHLYWLAFYWSAMTITSVGFGDILPQNVTEYILSAFLMLIGGLIWATLIGTIVTAVGAAMVRDKRLREQQGLVDAFITRHALHRNRGMRQFRGEIHQYLLDRFYKHSLCDAVDEDKKALNLLTYRMRTKLQLFLAKASLIKVRQFRNCDDLAILYLVQNLEPLAFAKHEVWFENSFRLIEPGGAFYIVQRGVAAMRRRYISNREDLVHSFDGRKFFLGSGNFGSMKSRTSKNLHAMSSHNIRKTRSRNCSRRSDMKKKVEWALSPSISSEVKRTSLHAYNESRVLGKNASFGLDGIVIEPDEPQRTLFRVETFTFFEVFALRKNAIMAAADEDVNLADALLWHRYRVKFIFWALSTLRLTPDQVRKSLAEMK